MKNMFIVLLLFFTVFGSIQAQYDFLTFDEDDGLPDKNCRGLAIDSTGTFWVGTQAGLAKWDGSNFVPVPIDDGVTDPFVSVVKVAPDGNIWVGYLALGDELGLSVIDVEGNLILHADSVLSGEPGTWVHDIAFGPDGLVYVAHQTGISTYDGMEWVLETESPTNFAATPVYDLEFAADGSLWVGTVFGLAHRMTSGVWQNYYTLSSNIIDNFIRTLEFDDQERLWIGTGQGVSIFDGTDFSNLTIGEGLIDPFVRDLAFDENGRAWIVTNDGFSIYLDGAFENYKTYEHPSIENKIENVIIDPNLGTWMATSEGAVKVENSPNALIEPTPALGELVQVYPVPAVDQLYVDWKKSESQKASTIQLLDMDGRIIQVIELHSGQSQVMVDLSSLVVGLYLLEIEFESEIVSKKVLKF